MSKQDELVTVMDTVKLVEKKNVDSSYSAIRYEGRQTTPPMDLPSNVDSSPLPDQQHRRQSLARKRTNEESYLRAETPKTSPKTAVFPRNSVAFADMPEFTGQDVKTGPVQSTIEASRTTTTATQTSATSTTPTTANTGFVEDIQGYQQQLNEEFQQFEQSLDKRNPAADLETMNWDQLQARYEEEIQPCIAQEKEIMDEFNARFAQFMLYMQVSNDHEAERATKRLRTRIALAQKSEGLLAQKQAHHEKVLEAFQTAMKLLTNA